MDDVPVEPVIIKTAKRKQGLIGRDLGRYRAGLDVLTRNVTAF